MRLVVEVVTIVNSKNSLKQHWNHRLLGYDSAGICSYMYEEFSSITFSPCLWLSIAVSWSLYIKQLLACVVSVCVYCPVERHGHSPISQEVGAVANT